MVPQKSSECHFLSFSCLQNPGIKENFFKASHSQKVIWIESKSVHIVESKLRVYEEYKELIDLNKILIHHASENCEDFLEKRALGRVNTICCKLSSFILKDVPTWSMITIKNTFRKWSPPFHIKQIAYGLGVPRKQRSVAEAVDLVQAILRILARRFQDDIYEDFAKYTNRILMQRLQTEMHQPIYSILNGAVKPSFSFCERLLAGDFLENCAEEISNILNSNEVRETFPIIEEHIKQVFYSTEQDASAILEEWRKLRLESMYTVWLGY